MSAAERRPGRDWPGYAACAWGVVFGAISLYWGSGGRIGLGTLGGTLEQQALAGDRAVLVAAWVTGLLKFVGAALALALVRPWGHRLPRGLLLGTAWTVAVVLGGYGAVLMVGDALGLSSLVGHPTAADRGPLWWHLCLWDLSFLVWGILFGLAAHRFAQGRR